MPTLPHIPAPTGRAGCKPALLLGPSRSQTHGEGHNRSASPSHVEGPQQARALRGEGWAGRCPPAGLPRGGAERARPRAGAAPRPRCRPLPPRPRLPAPPGELGNQPVSASGPIGLRGALSRQAGGGTPFEAVRQGSWPGPRPLLPLLFLPGHFRGRVARNETGLPRCVGGGVEFPAFCLRDPGSAGSAESSEAERAPSSFVWAQQGNKEVTTSPKYLLSLRLLRETVVVV